MTFAKLVTAIRAGHAGLVCLVVAIGHWGCSDSLGSTKPEGPTAASGASQQATHIATEPVEADGIPSRVPELPSFTDLQERAYAVMSSAVGHDEPLVRIDFCDAVQGLHELKWTAELETRVQADPDPRVRACAAETLGLLDNRPSRPILKALYRDAQPAQRAWYAQALYRLGERDARRALHRLVRTSKPAVGFTAAKLLAEISEAGDRRVIRILKSMHELWVAGEIAVPHASVELLLAATSLGDRRSRDILYRGLEAADEASRLAAAEALVKLGDDSGREVLLAMFNDKKSPNRVIAAILLAKLGVYYGQALLLEELASDTSKHRRLAARGVAEIRDKDSVEALASLLDDDEPRVRTAAAAGVLALLAQEPTVLAESVVAWAEHALRDDDWTSRAAVARLSSELPEGRAIAVLSQASFDRDARVRWAAAHSAVSIKGSLLAAEIVASALAIEGEPEVREQQVRALARIGRPEVIDTLQEIASIDTRAGVLALGSLIALGVDRHISKLFAAYENGRRVIRVAAMESAILADHPSVVDLLLLGMSDRRFEVRFEAARGLQHYKQVTDPVVAVLRDGHERGGSFAGLALQSLQALGEPVNEDGQLAGLLQSRGDVMSRRAAVRALANLTFSTAAPLLRMASGDPDVEVRMAVVYALAEHAEDPRRRIEGARGLQRLIHDGAPVVRYAARAQLAKISNEILPPEEAGADTPAAGDLSEVPAERVRAVFETVKSEQASLERTHVQLKATIAALKRRTARRARSYADVEAIEHAGARLDKSLQELLVAHRRVESAIVQMALAVGQGDAQDAEILVEVRAGAPQRRDRVAAAQAQVEATKTRLGRWLADEAGRCDTSLAAARSALEWNRLRETKRQLRAADKACDADRQVSIDFLKGEYHDARSVATKYMPRAQAQSLLKALKYYQRVTAVEHSGFEFERARERIEAIETGMSSI